MVLSFDLVGALAVFFLVHINFLFFFKGGSAAADTDDSIDWNTEDELEIENYPGSGSREASSSTGAGSSNSKLFDQFIGMGFSKELVAKVINEIGEENTDAILNHLLTYKELENSPLALENSPRALENSPPELENFPQEPQNAGFDHDSDPLFSSDYEGSLDDFLDSNSETEEVINPVGVDQKKIHFLAEMGYTMDEALIAVKRCGANAPANELADFIFAARFAKAEDVFFPEEKPKPWVPCDFSKLKKRNGSCYSNRDRKLQRRDKDSLIIDDPIQLPNPMVGFGVPTDPGLVTHRTLPEAAIGPPYFYYENVALAPKGVWDTISRFLYDVEPEFVDSKYFCAAARKRGYVHNLPIHNRFPLLPLPPRTIHEAFPMTRKWWPAWDTRTKLNCLQTCIGSAKLTERIRKSLEGYDEEPPLHVQRYVLNECRKWNLVWVGRNKVAVLEADEVEMLLGFPKNHTRGISRTDRYKSLGNSFQVDTVAYHLSVLKDLFPGGINLLSLFSGIGGAEVALHRLGVRLKNVVSVEKSEVNQNVMRSWWETTNQKGILIHMDDVQQLNADKLEQFMNAFGGFDLIVGGSPCNNLAGSNRHHRDGLEGKESSLFYDYFRILDLVKCITSKGQ